MSSPINVDIPHRLGQAEARRRIGGGIHRLEEHLPAAAQVASRWEGDRMHLDVSAMGQQVGATIDVEETVVRLQVRLPAFLSFFGTKVEALLRREGAALLEDGSAKKP
jgi:hypothetical protein